MGRPLIVISLGVLSAIQACSPTASDTSSIATDSASIARGRISFIQNCSACHNFRQDGIGPQLGGLTEEVTVTWIKKFVNDPKTVIQSGDERAARLWERYKAYMPGFSYLKNEEMETIISFIHTQRRSTERSDSSEMVEISNPIPDTITLSDLVLGLELVAQAPPTGKEKPLTRINKLDFMPQSDKLFLLDLRGKLYFIDGSKPKTYFDLAKSKSKFIHEPGLGTGFGSFAFHPDFQKNGLLYTTHTESPGSPADFGYADSIQVTVQWVLSEWKTDSPDEFPFSGKSRDLLRINMVTGIHGVQEITFKPLSQPGDEDYGLLYICVGDGGAPENGFPFLAHSRELVWGTILRIDPAGRNSANGQYGIPPTNPFVAKDENALGELYAYGFRNPHRITWLKSGEMVASNIGQRQLESVNIIHAGHDYGWPIREGTFTINPFGDINKVYPLPANDSVFGITYPLAQYDHDEGRAISGGFEYEGNSLSQLKGKYLFGDIMLGRLFYVDLAVRRTAQSLEVKEWSLSDRGRPVTLQELCGNERVDLRFGRDRHGELYVFTKTDGKVYRLTNAK